MLIWDERKGNEGHGPLGGQYDAHGPHIVLVRTDSGRVFNGRGGGEGNRVVERQIMAH
jgi:hypothetical protein